MEKTKNNLSQKIKNNSPKTNEKKNRQIDKLIKSKPGFPSHIYWNEIIRKIESETAKEVENEFFDRLDSTISIPKSIRSKIRKNLPCKPKDILLMEQQSSTISSTISTEFDAALLDDSDEITIHQRQRKDEEKLAAEAVQMKKDLVYNESECSNVITADIDYPHINLRIEKPKDPLPEKEAEHNWMSSYVCKARAQRVVWNSILYPQKEKFYEKTQEEQADQIMEVCSERFAEWLNSIGSDRKEDINKDFIKNLFTVQNENTLAYSLKTQIKEVNSIAESIAKRWNVPEMALETKFQSIINKRCVYRPRKLIRHAFGRTIQEKDLPWRPRHIIKPIKTCFPSKLLNGEVLFKGISHLRTVKKFIDFCSRNPIIHKPKYLVKCGHFAKQRAVKLGSDVPLYDRLNLKY